jgi:hypothetical protein
VRVPKHGPRKNVIPRSGMKAFVTLIRLINENKPQSTVCYEVDGVKIRERTYWRTNAPKGLVDPVCR